MYRIISCGVNKSPGQAPLSLAENDAERVSTFYSSAVGPVNGEVITLLGTAASSEGILKAFLGAQRADYLVFYFSGHGGATGIAVADGLLDYQTLASLLRFTDAQHVFVILDVCSAASAAGFLKEARVGGLGGIEESWLAALASATPGTRLIFSSDAGESARESANLGGGVFTHYFLEAAAKTPGDIEQGKHRWVSEMRACAGARHLMAEAGIEQRPIYYGLTGDFPIALSQADQAIGNGCFTRALVKRQSLNVGFKLTARRGVSTLVQWKLFNWKGKLVASATDEVSFDDDSGSYSGEISCPHRALEGDMSTRLRLMTDGVAPIAWEIEMTDKVGNVIDSHGVRAVYRAPRIQPDMFK